MSTNEDIGPEEMHKALFTHLIMSLASSAMQHMGKLVSPVTGKSEVNLEAAQSTVDVIEMLQAKTRGNLDGEESRFLTQTLTALRLNYVETASAPQKPAEPAKASEPAKTAEPEGAAGSANSEEAGKATEAPRPADEPVESKKRFSQKYD